MNNGIQLIIPLVIFLVLLALGQVFNREQQVAQQRRSTGSPLGPRPAIGGSSWSSATGPRDQPARARLAPDVPAYRARATDDGIVIIERFPNSPGQGGTTEALAEAGPSRRPRRKARQPAAEKRSSSTSQSTATRLGGAQVNVSHPNLNVSAEASLASSLAGPPAVQSDTIVDAIRNPARVREAVVLSAILQPPPGRARLSRRR